MLSIDFHSRLDEEQLIVFDTATDIVTDLINVEREGNVAYCKMLCSFPIVLSGAYSRSF